MIVRDGRLQDNRMILLEAAVSAVPRRRSRRSSRERGQVGVRPRMTFHAITLSEDAPFMIGILNSGLCGYSHELDFIPLF